MTAMNGDAVNNVAELAREAEDKTPIWFASPDGRSNRLVDKDGNLTNEVWLTPRKHKAHTLVGFGDMVRDYAARGDGTNQVVRVFASPGSIVAVLDDNEERADRVVFETSYSEAFDTLLNWSVKLRNIKQADLEWLLRSQFDGRVDPADFIACVRNMTWTTGGKVESKIDEGGASAALGAEVEAELSVSKGDGTKGKLPTKIMLRTTAYRHLEAEWDDQNEAKTWAVRLNLRVDHDQKAFTLRPVDGDLDRVKRQALDHVVDRLRKMDLGANVQVFNGAESNG